MAAGNVSTHAMAMLRTVAHCSPDPLAVALRKQRRRERLVAATLSSLRQLRLQEVE